MAKNTVNKTRKFLVRDLLQMGLPFEESNAYVDEVFLDRESGINQINIIFKHENKFWQIEVGLDGDSGFNSLEEDYKVTDEIEAVEVEKITVTTEKWVPTK